MLLQHASSGNGSGSMLARCWGRCWQCLLCPCVCYLRIVRAFLLAVSRYIRPTALLLLTAVALIWGEAFVYWNASREWSSHIAIHDEQNIGDTTIRILLVSDPQLVGEVMENPFAGPLTRWDCDNFLRTTFTRAFEISKPHIVLFIGDLLDEGGVASTEALARYSRRFENIFNTRRNKLTVDGKKSGDSSHKAEFVAYWGDNDLQQVDGIMPELMETYRKRLAVVATSLGLDIVDVAPCRSLLDGTILIRHYDPLLTDERRAYDQDCKGAEKFETADVLAKHLPAQTAHSLKPPSYTPGESEKPLFRMLVSHYPLVGGWAEPLDRSRSAAIQYFSPHVIIAGHMHEAVIAWCHNCFELRAEIFTPVTSDRRIRPGDKPLAIPLPRIGKDSAPQPHIMIPTCSYRMGTPFTGYGVITLNPKKYSLTFSVFWNPPRYTTLAVYLVIGCIIILRLVAFAYVTFESGNLFLVFMNRKRTHLG